MTYRTSARRVVPAPRGKKVSSLWTLVPWLVPSFLVRFVPPWVIEKVERAVYDGFTRAEWTAIQVRQIEESARMQGWTKIEWERQSAAKVKP